MKHSRAFTLLEMVVAIGIFAVLAVISYASLNRFLDHRDVLQEEMTAMKDLQLAFSLLEQDMRFISERLVRDGYGDAEPLLIINNANVDGELLRFTTARRSVSVADTSALQRVAYRLEDGDFFRVSWQVLDRAEDSQERRQLLLTDLDEATVSVLQSTVGADDNLGDIEAPDRLPAGVEWRLTMANGKQYRRLFEVKGSQPE